MVTASNWDIDEEMYLYQAILGVRQTENEWARFCFAKSFANAWIFSVVNSKIM